MKLLTMLFFLVFTFCLNDVYAETYQYDTLNRLTSVEYDSGQTITYQYDDAGNITSSITSGVTDLLTIQTPNGNETWQAGTSHTLQWSSTFESSQTVKIALYRGTIQTQIITNSTANTGSFTWAIPASLTPHSDYRIKITSNSDTSISDSSDTDFSITAADYDHDGIPDYLDSDDDNDGLSDVVELDNGLNPFNFDDAAEDADHDGFSNIEEIEASTDINDITSKPKILQSITTTKVSELLGINGYKSIALDDNYAYLLTSNKLEIVDIRDESNILAVSELALDGITNKLVKSGNYVYVARCFSR